jgi:hypothetical protein
VHSTLRLPIPSSTSSFSFTFSSSFSSSSSSASSFSFSVSSSFSPSSSSSTPLHAGPRIPRFELKGTDAVVGDLYLTLRDYVTALSADQEPHIRCKV